MFKPNLSALLRLIVAAIFVLSITACELINTPAPTPPDIINPEPDEPIEVEPEPEPQPEPEPEPEPEPQPEPDPIVYPEVESCSASNNDLELLYATPVELFLACQIINNPDQQRSEMHYHPTLGKLAQARAEDMAENGYYGGERYGIPYPPHVDHDGYGPDHYLCQAKYRPDMYCYHSDIPFSNTVESISGRWNRGNMSEEVALLRDYEKARTVWLNSPPHKRHIMGEHEYFKASNYYGVGQAVRVKTEDVVDENGVVRTVSVRHSMWVFIAAYPPLD